MPNLPPTLSGELFYDGVWNAAKMRVSPSVSVTRGLTSESTFSADPMSTEVTLDNRLQWYSPRNPESPLYGKIGRNTPFRLSVSEGGPHLNVPAAGNYGFSTPHNAALNITGDIDIRVDVTPLVWTDPQALTVRYTPGTVSWSLATGPGGYIYLWWTQSGTKYAKSTMPIACANGERSVIRATLDVDNGAGGWTVQFWQGKDADSVNEWSMLGDPVTVAGTTSLPSITAAAHVGDNQLSLLPDSSSGFGALRGKIHAVKILNGINGTAVINIKTSRDASVGGSSFTDAAGRVWTRSGVSSLSNTHIRSIGEVPSWPPTRDLTGNDTKVTINPSGITRRLDAGNKPIDSALLRYLKFNPPIQCWPMTDGKFSTEGRSLVGQASISGTLVGPDSQPSWGEGSLGDWVEPTVNFVGGTVGTMRGAFPNSASAAAKWSVDFFLTGDTGGLSVVQFSDRGAGTDADNQVVIRMVFDYSVNSVAIIRESLGDSGSSTGLLANVASVGITDVTKAHHIRLTVDPTATDSVWDLYVDGQLKNSGLISGIVMKALKTFSYTWGTTADQSVGYITYWDGSGPSASDVYQAFIGFQGEKAATRINRLCSEAGVISSVSGPDADSVGMGVQNRQKFLELLNVCGESDLGYLLERRDANEILYRSHTTLYDQAPSITLDFAQGVISEPFSPVDDDRLTRNDVSVQREGGTAPDRQVLESGTMSILDPPNGVGRYDVAYTRNVASDYLASQLAYHYLHVGTFEGVRYTRITLNLANPRVYEMLADVYRADVGDKIRLLNIPRDHGVGPVDVLIHGYSEDIGADSWKITFNCIPAEPWTVGITDNPEFGRADANNSTLGVSATSGATSLTVATAGGSARWVDSATYPADFPFNIRVGGEVMTVTAITGTSSPQTFTVVRSVNGVVKPQTAGSEVSLETPVYVAL